MDEMDQQDDWGLEDLSQDVHLIFNVKLTQFPWLIIAAFAGLILADLPVPGLFRILLFLIPPATTVAYLSADGPMWARRILDYRRRPRRARGPAVAPAPGALVLSETVTPLADLGDGRFTAAAVIEPMPFALADADERARRIRAWAALLNAASAHEVQVDVYTSHHPDADWRSLAAAAAMPAGAASGELGRIARMRLRHFAGVAARDGYRPAVIIRLSAGARDAQDAWQRFRACEAAFSGSGIGWSWASGAWLWAQALELADPGAAVRRMAERAQEMLSGGGLDAAEGGGGA
ncbi:MAG: hypothetical protein QJR08_00305 [Bacillota bacterium]|nr:hypothetical protein [Bacillota bacterium]